MEFHNTTDIPIDLIKVVIAFSAQPGIEIKSIKLRNKKEGLRTGNFGMYYHNKHISLTIPPIIDNPICYKLANCGKYIAIRNRIEFVVYVMAHELRHAYQFQVKGLEFLNACSAAKEYDAEMYGFQTLERWRDLVK